MLAWASLYEAASRQAYGGETRPPRLLIGRSHFSGSNIDDVACAFHWTEGLWLHGESIAVAVVADSDLLNA